MSTVNRRKSAVPKSVCPVRIERLTQVIESSGLGRRDFASAVGVSESNINEMLHGRSGIAVPVAERVARVFGISAGWLLFGEEPSRLVGEGEAVYHRAVRLLDVAGREGAELPAGLRVWRVEGDDLAPGWRRGQRLLVVRAVIGETGPAVVRIGRTAWRVVGEIF